MSPAKGIISAWKSEKGFGFIRPDGGGTDVFVHIRDFGVISRKPMVGDKVTYQPMRGEDGRLRAADVHIAGLARIPTSKPMRPLPTKPKQSEISKLGPIGMVLISVVVATTYWYSKPSKPVAHAKDIIQPELYSSVDTYKCEGKHYCSEISSCAEAEYYLRHCPGTEMDGDRDGKPCEDQCGH